MNAFDKAIKSISDKLFLHPYQEELIKVLQEQERDNWVKEQLKLCEQYPNTYEITKSISELEPKPLDIDTQISNIKRQLKHEKNPLVIKNLNRKMNKLIKEKKNDSRRNEKKIKEVCCSHDLCNDCPLYNKTDGCWNNDVTDEEIKENYKLMFEKEESEMENEFDFNELEAGMAIKTLDSDELIIGVQMKNDIVFFNKNYTPIISKKNIVDKIYSENFDVLEVYGFSDDNFNLFDTFHRPLFWKKEENKNFKVYEIGSLEIKPNYEGKEDGYKTEKEDFLFIENISENDEYVTIRKSELDAIINALTEIRDFIKEGE